MVFPDWSNPVLTSFIIEFYQKLAERYPDQSRGLGFVEFGFGFWAEYHIDFDNLSGFSHADADTIEEAPGRLFPSRIDQQEILRSIGRSFTQVPWGISVDAADTDFGPYPENVSSNAYGFGLFDDSLLHEAWEDENMPNWNFFGPDIRKTSNGGEFSYYTFYDQEHALDSDGPHGLSLEEVSERCFLSFVIGDGQSEFRTVEQLARAGRLLGYRLVVEELYESSGGVSVLVHNDGPAPVCYPIFAAFGSVQSSVSLEGLGPGESRLLTVPCAGPDPETFAFVSPVLLPGQRIPFSVP